MKKIMFSSILAVLGTLGVNNAMATPFTETSPVLGGTSVAPGITAVGGVVFDAIGFNDVRVSSELPASSLFVGFFNTGTPATYQGNPGTIGIQTGFNAAITNQLGGGFKEVAVRITLHDGDTAAGEFDENDNTLLINGLNFGNWSDVNAQYTDNTGTIGYSMSGGGFRNGILDTGWFYSNDAALLADLWNTVISTEQLVFQVYDVDPYDNFFDFTQGVDAGLINLGQGPTTGSVPEPGALILLGLGLAGFGFKRSKTLA